MTSSIHLSVYQQVYLLPEHIRRRAPVIEGLFAEAKQRHGLGRAWRRGLIKMRVQCLLIAAVMNFKRLVGIKPRLSAAARPSVGTFCGHGALCRPSSSV